MRKRFVCVQISVVLKKKSQEWIHECFNRIRPTIVVDSIHQFYHLLFHIDNIHTVNVLAATEIVQ